MPAFPTVSAPIVAWLDGTLPEYTDSGGSVVAAAGDLVRRINEASPLTARWNSASDAQRALRSTNALRLDPFGPTYPGRNMVRSAVASLTSINNCTIVVCYLPRDGYGTSTSSLIGCSSPNFGIQCGGGSVEPVVNGSTWAAFSAGPAITGANSRGSKMSVGVRWGSSQVRASLLVNGATATNTLTTAVTGGTLSQPFNINYPFNGAQGFYGEIGQAIVFDGQLSDAELTAVLAWCDANTMAVGFPLTAPLGSIVSDSIWRAGVGTQVENAAWSIVLKALRAGVAPTLEMTNVGKVGAGAGTACYTDQLQALHSSARVKEIAYVAVGTNNLANGQSAAVTLAATYALCDLMRADGIKVILQNILPRQGTLFNPPGDQAFFNANVSIVNADFAAHWAAHADAFVDAASVAGLDNPSNTTYYQADKVHPTDAGQAALAAVALPAFVALLSATPTPPQARVIKNARGLALFGSGLLLKPQG
jgi:lysophospholipase L1-like esterase